MGVNWTTGLIRWKPHVDGKGNVYPLNHLHRFRTTMHLPQGDKLPACDVDLHLAFGLHTFTHRIRGDDAPADFYSDFFFTLMKVGSNSISLLVQSAYEPTALQKASACGGRIGFTALAGHALRGTRPKRPPR